MCTAFINPGCNVGQPTRAHTVSKPCTHTCTACVAHTHLFVTALEGHEWLLPALLPHAYRPVAAAGQEEGGVDGAPLQRKHGPDVPMVRLQVLLAVAGAALVYVAVLSACR
jgi:hypothetical protein